MPLGLDEIIIPDGRRPAKPEAVKRLAESIDKIGLRHPITVRRKGEEYILVAGLHRMEAYRRLERDHIPALIVSMTINNARMWEIAENLHRAELTVQERSDHIAEWIKLSQVETVSKGGRGNVGGVNAAVRELDIERSEAHRAVKIASMSPEAKDAARDAGIDNNQTKLLKVASLPRSQQVSGVKKVIEPISDEEAVTNQVSTLMSAWNRASPEARAEFLSKIEQPVMGKRWA